MAIISLYADTLVSAGAVTNGSNAFGVADGVWTGNSGDDGWTATWGMENPPGDLIASSTQTLRVTARQAPNGGNPADMTVTLVADGADVTTFAAVTPAGTGSTHTFTFNETSITDPATVQVRINGGTSGGNPNTRQTIQVDAIEWQADVLAFTGDMVATLDDSQAYASGAHLPDPVTDFTVADYVDEYYVFVEGTAGPVTPTGDLIATLDDTTASVTAEVFPPYWQKISGEATIAAGEVSAHVSLQVLSGNNGAWWFDSAVATINGGPNVLVNGDFEAGTKTGWDAAVQQDGTIATTGASVEPPGTYVMRLDVESVTQEQDSNSFAVTEGDVVYVEVWVYALGASNGNGRSGFRFRDSAGDETRTVIVGSATPAGAVGELNASTSDTTASATGQHGPGWHYLSGQTTVQATEDDCRPRLRVNLGAATGGWYYDNVSVRRNGVEQMLNVGFETGDKTGWDAESAQAGVVQLVNGNYVLSIDVGAADRDQDANRFAVVEGDLIEASCWVKQYGVLDPGSTAELVVSFLTAGGAFVRYQNLDTQVPESDVAGDLAATTADTEASASAAHGVAGDLAASTDDTEASATATHGVAGDLTAATDDTVASFSGSFGQDVVGDLAATTADTGASIAAAHGVTGDLSADMADTIAVATMSHGVAGDLSSTLDQTTAAGTGSHGVAGDLAADTADTVAAFDGSFGSDVDGDLVATTADTAALMAGDHGVAADIAASTSTTADIAASHGVVGDLAAGVDDTVAAVAVSHGVVGTAAAESANVEASASASHGVAGDLSAELDATTASLTGQHAIAGTLDASTEDTTASFDAEYTPAGEGALLATLDDVTASSTGAHGVAGTITTSVGDLSLEITVAHGVAGAAVVELDSTEASISASYEDSSRSLVLDAQLDDVSASVSGTHYAEVSGSVAAQLDDTVGASQAVHGVAGALSAVLEGTTGLFTFKPPSIGRPTNPGVMDRSRVVTAVYEATISAVLETSTFPGAVNVSKTVTVSDTTRWVGVRSGGQAGVILVASYTGVEQLP